MTHLIKRIQIIQSIATRKIVHIKFDLFMKITDYLLVINLGTLYIATMNVDYRTRGCCVFTNMPSQVCSKILLLKIPPESDPN